MTATRTRLLTIAEAVILPDGDHTWGDTRYHVHAFGHIWTILYAIHNHQQRYILLSHTNPDGTDTRVWYTAQELRESQ